MLCKYAHCLVDWLTEARDIHLSTAKRASCQITSLPVRLLKWNCCFFFSSFYGLGWGKADCTSPRHLSVCEKPETVFTKHNQPSENWIDWNVFQWFVSVKCISESHECNFPKPLLFASFSTSINIWYHYCITCLIQVNLGGREFAMCPTPLCCTITCFVSWLLECRRSILLWKRSLPNAASFCLSFLSVCGGSEETPSSTPTQSDQQKEYSMEKKTIASHLAMHLLSPLSFPIPQQGNQF